MVHVKSLIHIFYGVWTLASFFVDGIFTLSLLRSYNLPEYLNYVCEVVHGLFLGFLTLQNKVGRGVSSLCSSSIRWLLSAT